MKKIYKAAVTFVLGLLLAGMMYSTLSDQDLNITTVGGGDAAPPGSFAEDEGYKIYWGDLHGHSTYSNDWFTSEDCDRGSPDSNCDPEGYFKNAIMFGLHFAAVTDHPETITTSQWEDTFDDAASINTANFFPFVGFEFCRELNPGTICSNIIYSNLDAPSYPLFSHESLTITGDATEVFDTSFPDMGDMWNDLNNDPNFEVLGLKVVVNSQEEFSDWSPGSNEESGHSCVEYASTGGKPWEMTFGGRNHRTLDYAIDTMEDGMTLCAVGTGNDHFAVPGRGPITGVLAKEVNGVITREAIWNALKDRRTYAVYGPEAGDGSGPGQDSVPSDYANNKYPGLAERIQLSFELELDSSTYLMGDEVTVASSSNKTLDFAIYANKDNQKIRKVTVLYVEDGVFKGTFCSGTNGSFDSVSFTCTGTQAPSKEAAYFAVVYFRTEDDQNDINPSMAWTSPIRVTVNVP